MSHGPEFKLAEKPCLEELLALGYGYLPPPDPSQRLKVPASSLRPGDNDRARDGANQVLLRDELTAALIRLNTIPEDVAHATYLQLLGVTDNERWTDLLRGELSKRVPGQTTHKTLQLIDFLHPENNTFTVTHQLYVHSQHPRIPDLVVYVNGIPLVVLEAKSPLSAKSKNGQAFEQIKLYEQQIPRLFYSNLLSIVTDGIATLYGTTGAPSSYWGTWRDPWPRRAEEFSSPLAKDLWCLLEPSRLLDLLAHFVVFERAHEVVTKKLCRYQQYRAVGKIVGRVTEGKHRQGLIWHTQGSGKSLTMVYAALKLKTHLTLESPALANPNLLVVTDRTQLDGQISDTFAACGLPNPRRIQSIRDLRSQVKGSSIGVTLLTTLQKFAGSKAAVEDSGRWIVLVDEAHRSQENDLGAYLRATLPEARLFGFTGTPVKKGDRDTYANFGVPGEGYLDRYSIDDAVADGATVPIRYTSRKTEWQIDPAKLDVLFDQWFADQPEEWVAEVKARGVTLADLAKHPERVRLIAYDLWIHFQQHVEPDGFKAQVVAIDREAVILYKRALDAVINEALIRQGLSPEQAAKEAAARSACVVSSSQEDAKPSEDPHTAAIRRDLLRHYLDDTEEKAALKRFESPTDPLSFLIVCNKLLTGFDAPIESVMYLDSPLRDHSLLQAIARTNRVYTPAKQFGLIVDYIGVTRSLGEALSTYRREDVVNALRNLDELAASLATAHADVMELAKGVSRGTGDLKGEYEALIAELGGEDGWFTFARKAQILIRAYEALSPDPVVLTYTEDLKWVACFLPYGRRHFEKVVALGVPDYSARIRDMLAQHLHVTGLATLLKLRKITDPEYWHDFQTEGKPPEEIREAAIRKATELKAITTAKTQDNPLRYGRFSERVLAIIERMNQNLEDVAVLLGELEKVSRDLGAEDGAHEATQLSERGYGLYKILEAYRPPGADVASLATTYALGDSEPRELSGLEHLADEVDRLYGSDMTAPPGWHLKTELRKELRQKVRERAFDAGLSDLKAVPARVEEFALRHYIKLH